MRSIGRQLQFNSTLFTINPFCAQPARKSTPINNPMNTNELLLPVERLLEIARQSVKKHCDESHDDFEDFVQDVLLGILQRQDEYDPSLSKVETFVISVAKQKACNRVTELRRRENAIGTNRNGCIPFRCSPEDVNELDANGNLACIDESVLFAQFFSFLDATHSAVLKLRMEGYTAKETRHLLGISVEEFHEARKNLFEQFEDFRFFQKNNAMRQNY